MPARRETPAARMPDDAPRIALAAPIDGAGVLILANPGSGQAVVRADPLPVIARRLPLARIHELRPGEAPGDVVRAALASASPPTVLGVLGGDGSVSTMAGLAREYGLPLFVLPAGTFNHFARAVGLDDVDAAIDAYQHGRAVRVGVATLTDGQAVHTVLNTASVGIYPDFIARRERRSGRWGKWLAGVWAAWRVLRDAEPLVVEIDGRETRVWSVFVGVGRNDPRQVATMQRLAIDDDVLDVRILHARGPRRHAVASLAFGRRTVALARGLRLMPRGPELSRRLAASVQIAVHARAEDVPGYGHDGELEAAPAPDDQGRYVLRMTMHPGALVVVA
ncbi:hypothetical protein M4I32_07620 [Microbacterium sp. LRZ72]|uniref:diacylglycerol/lipid kinase family protein n=1 Tax=Microbacterium sp. LRZ72 TaxID=2942481 RepID=UPI0029AE3EC4|nr:diacylglycerol kinase family protein [Microbacterium sp. LRZ72]MDX2376667.1 hypothetical protein [Microbacterium sp. LRZ72]